MRDGGWRASGRGRRNRQSRPAIARRREVLVTRTVVNLVAGSGLTFKDRGMHSLAKAHKGWRVYAAEV
jgi:hypothetical protein